MRFFSFASYSAPRHLHYVTCYHLLFLLLRCHRKMLHKEQWDESDPLRSSTLTMKELKKKLCSERRPENSTALLGVKHGVEIIYIYSYIHSYIPPYIHTSIHTYIHPYIHAYMHPFIHTSIHTYTHSYIHTFIHPYIHLNLNTSIHIYIHTSIHS